MTTKELPLSEQPYEKCERLGAEALSDAELLAIIIKTGVKGERSIDLANRLLLAQENTTGLAFLNHTSLPELTEISGIGRVKALQLLATAEISKRLSSIPMDKQSFSSPLALAKRYMPLLRHQQQEKVYLIMLDTKCHILKECTVFTGTVNSSPLAAREIFLLAVKYRAVFIVLLHNHPSGDPAPSHADIISTRKIQEAGNLLGIQLMDHIIVGDNEYISLKEKGFL